MVGLKKISIIDFAKIFESKGKLGHYDSKQVYTAPARGLCLDHCYYDDIDDITNLI